MTQVQQQFGDNERVGAQVATELYREAPMHPQNRVQQQQQGSGYSPAKIKQMQAQGLSL